MSVPRRSATMKELINKLREAAKESFFYSDMLSKAADTLLDCRNELCLKCEGYKQRYLSPCENCRWKDV